jgi:hypothetical protein
MGESGGRPPSDPLEVAFGRVDRDFGPFVPATHHMRLIVTDRCGRAELPGADGAAGRPLHVVRDEHSDHEL